MKNLKHGESMLRIFRNINWTRRDYECTNIVACRAKEAPNDNWVECEEEIVERLKLKALYGQGGVSYLGYL
jgi:hypothetical protein